MSSLSREAALRGEEVKYKTYTPQNKHGSPENGGPLEKEIPNLETIISRFQPLIFGGVCSQISGGQKKTLTEKN